DRAVRLCSGQLDRALYDQEGFCEGVLRLATRHPNAEVMILVRDTADLVSRHHRLVELFLRLTSRIQLRKLNPERETLHTEFLVGDEESVLYNQLAGGYQGYYYRYAPLEARRLGQDFDSLWDSSEPDPAIRRLHICVLPPGLGEAAIGVEQRLGVAGGLLPPLQHQVPGSGEGEALRQVRGHRPVGGIPSVLAIDHRRHPRQGIEHLLLAADAVAQPVGDVLARDPQGGAILHQRHIVDI